ncbi:MAG: Hsp70 family protein [Burkholderiales bacterium]|nr:Hsp70 family protein [Burkholderiales bacterium]
MNGPQYLGIDLGTTNSTAAVFDGERVTLIRNAGGSPLTPSVVRIDGKGVVTVGAKARRHLETDGANTRTEFKRLMGTAEAIAFPAARLTRRPEELSALVLASLRADVKAQLGFDPEFAVVTVPALFELPQSSATAEAARLAGFTRIELLQEPVASALAAGWSREHSEGAWLVYDLGGGTFDASLLETRDGHLRVVGHDGDNFLGGRDLDTALVDWALAELSRLTGAPWQRADPRLARALPRLRHAAEEAKIELSRADQAEITLPALETGDGGSTDVDLTISRAVFEALCAPLIERSLDICRRLCTRHQTATGKLARIVLVGGPTVIPCLRRRLAEALEAPLAEGHDPMTLVAEGAALYAASAGLDARRPPPPPVAAWPVLLKFPAVSSSLHPHVVGKRLDAPAAVTSDPPVRLHLERTDDAWQGAPVEVADDGSFVLAAELRPRSANGFRVQAVDRAGKPVPVTPATITITQGYVITDPPLSRSIGIALASNRVRVYFERGTPLPTKRTFVLRTVESVARHHADSLLTVPVVQGEFELAHLCRLVGTLEIPGRDVKSDLAAGAELEITLEVDRGGRLSARAFVPALEQVFDGVAHPLMPGSDPATIESCAEALDRRLTEARGKAALSGVEECMVALDRASAGLEEVRRDLAAARGGDSDAGLKARRGLLDAEAALVEVEDASRWPDLTRLAQDRSEWAAGWVSEYGTAAEQRLLHAAEESLVRALRFREATEVQRQMRAMASLGRTAFHRAPDAWQLMFDDAASRAEDATDLPRAQQLVREGRQARERQDRAALERVTRALWGVLPPEVEERRLGFDSGVR